MAHGDDAGVVALQGAGYQLSVMLQTVPGFRACDSLHPQVSLVLRQSNIFDNIQQI